MVTLQEDFTQHFISLFRESDRFSLDAEVDKVGVRGRLVQRRHKIRKVRRGVEWRRWWKEVGVGPESRLEVGRYFGSD